MSLTSKPFTITSKLLTETFADRDLNRVVIRIYAAGNQYYTVQDKLHSVRGLVKRDGTGVLSMVYRPWGGALDSGGTQHSLLRYRWTGREFDSETGFYFHRTRYYSPAARRFVQEDAIGFAGGANLYSYVDGMVLEGTDPNGLMMKPADRSQGFGGPGGGGIEYDPFSYFNYMDMRRAERDAAYEDWVAAGSYAVGGQRVLGYETVSTYAGAAGGGKNSLSQGQGIIVRPPQTAARVRDCAQASLSCARMLTELTLQRAPTEIREGSLNNPGLAVTTWYGGHFLGAVVTIDAAQFSASTSLGALPYGIAFAVVPGHELGHVVGGLSNRRAGDLTPGCGENCARIYENQVRSDLGISARGYSY